MRRWLIVAALLAGCAAPSTWTKPGITQAQWEADKADCANRLYTSPAATSIAGAAVLGPEIMRTCLRSKGYVEVQQPQTEAATIPAQR